MAKKQKKYRSSINPVSNKSLTSKNTNSAFHWQNGLFISEQN